MKKIMAVVLMLILISLVIGCGKKSQQADVDEKDQQKITDDANAQSPVDTDLSDDLDDSLKESDDLDSQELDDLDKDMDQINW